MASLSLGFTGSINNSLQVGDYVFYVNVAVVQGATNANASFTSNTNTTNAAGNQATPVLIGEVEDIQTNPIDINANSGTLSDFYDPTTSLTTLGITPDFIVTITQVVNWPVDANQLLANNGVCDDGDFILFAKNNKYNKSSLKGYYAQAHFVNNSTKKAELFAATCGVEESSK